MDILQNVSEVQREGILHRGSPLLLLSGAGSGKTLVITRKIAYLINELETPPENIIAVTFTNKAAYEMKERVSALVPDIKPSRLFIRTFHSACLRILKENAHFLGYKSNFLILDEGDKLSVIKRIMKEEKVPKSITPKMINKFISAVKNNMDDGITFDRDIFENVYKKYTEHELNENVMDFDDLILNTIKLFEEEKKVLNFYRNRFKYVLVDEFQDTNPQQYKLIKLLTQNADNDLTVVGDDDQSIYAFRGADVLNILDFEKDYPNTKIVRLEENYRCPKDVVEAALSIIKNNTNRHEKNVFSNKPNEFKIENWICYSDLEEARSVVNEIESLFDNGFEAKDIVILFRTNSQSRAYEKELKLHSINYKIVGGVGFFERIEIKDSISFLRLMMGFGDNFSVRRTVNVPPRGIGEKSFNSIETFANTRKISLYEAIDYADEISLSKKVASSIKAYKSIIEEYGIKIKEDISNEDGIHIEEIFFNFLKDIDYFSIFKSEGNERIITAEENIKELFRGFYDYKNTEPNASLITFLEENTLYRDINTENENEDYITLMTVHNAKGLEFDAVFITGLEQGVFPHYFSLEEEGGIDEERRLLYVAITRAKRKLYLTYSKKRRISSGIMEQIPSSFLMEIPKRLMLIKEKANYYSGNYMDIDEDAFDY
ncbi:ATP-dependent helicase [Brachyspira murdochii]|uniref:DNA 3'-5' helicase n=1 Tax=Brachyspira murdochii (strain ATCC 51284 / DSM 12563 / 56-150) TaxID=526224 RepID=D5UA52_BRAM5|nr:UvrD-helicase domain-containing protein [Brachyspira murdochii]ADG71575.1 UvrD/REP helicase [Brachyspira murdochii DSM 12563]